MSPATSATPAPPAGPSRAQPGARRPIATRSRRRAYAGALAVVLALAVTGCSSIPLLGPVTEGNVELEDPNPLYLQVYGPTADAAPEQIVRGFLTAQAGGANDNFATAREFLSTDVREVWKPEAQTIVYSGDLTLETVPGGKAPQDPDRPDTADPSPDAGKLPGATSSIMGPSTDGAQGATDAREPAAIATVAEPELPAPPIDPLIPPVEPSVVTLVGHVGIYATLDSEGRFTEAAANAPQDVIFTLERDDAKQWRITKTADGALIQQANFATGYRATNLYFLSPDEAYLVPEVRWYPQRSTATYAIQALLAGPSPWLRDGVRTAIPDGTSLAIDAVSIDGAGAAEVDLSGNVLVAPPEQRAMLVAQIEATLLRLTGVSTVRVMAAGSQINMGGGPGPLRDPTPRSAPIGLQGGQLKQLVGRTLTSKVGLAPVAGADVTGLSLGDNDGPVVIRIGRNTLALVPADGRPISTLLTGREIRTPSVDRFGWVWTSSADRPGMLRSIRPGSREVGVSSDWLSEQAIMALRVSRDGTRVAVVSRVGAITQIDVAAIVRDASGAPTKLGPPITVGASLVAVEDVVWVDDTTLGVLGQASEVTPVAVHTVPIGRHSESFTVVEGVTSLTSGRGPRALFVGTAANVLWTRSTTGTNWTQVAEDISLFTFPG